LCAAHNDAGGAALVAVSQSLGLYAELEGAAQRIYDYSSELLHGLLQTADHARAVISADPTLAPDVVAQRVAFRIERQRRFFARGPRARLETVITAGVMNLQVGSPSVMKDQVAHLRAVEEEGAACVSVLSASNGVHRAMRGPFLILTFEDPDDPSVVYTEHLLGSRYIERPADVAQFRQVFDEVRRQALPLEEWWR
jgi:hypothetical protein